jgi:hypothetical protein
MEERKDKYNVEQAEDDPVRYSQVGRYGENVKTLLRFSLIGIITIGILNSVGGCSTRGSGSSLLTQTQTIQQDSSEQTKNALVVSEPTSLETFSAFLDRG